MNVAAVELELGKSSYAKVAERLQHFSDDELFALLDSKSIRIGDTAASFLRERKKHDTVIDAILHSRIKSTIGRLRATNVLLPSGKRVPRAELMYLHLLNDPSARVVDNALFGLVFWQNKKNIPAIESAKSKAKPGSKISTYCEKAVEALKREDPFLIAPYFADPSNVWELSPEQIGDHHL